MTDKWTGKEMKDLQPEKEIQKRRGAVCSVFLEKGLVSWLQEGKGTCPGSAPRGGGEGTGVND